MSTARTAGLAPVAPSPAQPRPTRRERAGKLDAAVSPYLYVAPFFLLFALIGLFPLLYTAFVSVHQWHTIGGEGAFVGLKNFADVLHQRFFWVGLRNTVSIFLLSSVPQVITAIFVAAILNANLRTKTFWRMGVLFPYVIAPVAISLIFGRMSAQEYGLVNYVLGNVGIAPVGWHSEPFAAHVAIASMINFRWTGYSALIFLAAMQAIPTELYEAAIVDGASRWRQFWSVTVPQLRPTIILIIIVSTIGGLQVFDEPLLYDQEGYGGNDRQWMTVTMYIYELGWGNQHNFGRAAAAAWLLFLVVVVLALANFAITRRIASADSGPRRKRVP